MLGPASVVLVTGGSGLLGHGLSNATDLMGTNIKDMAKFVWLSSKDGDLRCYESMKKIFEQNKPTHVVHLAARVGGVFANMADNLGFFRENSLMNDSVLRLCHEYNVGRAVFCLSTCVFPAEAPLPLTEEALQYNRERERQRKKGTHTPQLLFMCQPYSLFLHHHHHTTQC
eukprot:GHVS01107053.1.p1 GENE.GHVS01107053.1~~GHVS01107053.1.p1  ORF type:complete len:171 (-),score=36.05 GHVS01107053.1:3-515(-)